MEYDILIRGFAQKNQLYDLLCLLSRDERDRILHNSWEELWDDYWIDHSSASYTGLKAQSKRRFDEIKTLLQLLDNDIPCKIYKRPYIFPKGKPNKNEEGISAALREAREETKGLFTERDGYLYFNSPIIQYYTGSDGKQYIDYYYVWCSYSVYASSSHKLYDIISQPTLKRGSSENEVDTQFAIDTLTALDSENREDNENKKVGKTNSNETLEPLIRFIRDANNSTTEKKDRLRNRTISHELESDAWIEIPLFTSVREKLEWSNSIDPYQEFGLFKRHFNAIMEIHDHFC